ncbi:MAG: CoB--CoM heterodisulfide reductase iron-sulfur subunit B family protein [Syntrophobacteraceae bacterium]
MKVSYYPGCTLKTKAKHLEDSALASLAALGVEIRELPRWNCCGAVHSLADDDLIHHVAPVRDLIRAMDEGSERLVTLCSMCYNTLARANLLMRNDEVKRKTINDFMTEEHDYHGEVEVDHMVPFLRDVVGWDNVRAKVKVPLSGMKIASYYGCTLVRPKNVAIEPVAGKIMNEFVEALGAEAVDFSANTLCCGSYQVLAHPDSVSHVVGEIIQSASQAGADALILSCPLCEYNLLKKQDELLQNQKIARRMPVFYFSQLLAMALGLGPESYRPDRNDAASVEFLKSRNFSVQSAATGA